MVREQEIQALESASNVRRRSVSSSSSKIASTTNVPQHRPPSIRETDLDIRDDQTKKLSKNSNDKSVGFLWSLSQIGSEVLENEGSVARDHMANERTFLSWIRTSLGLATVGVGITQLFKLSEDNHKNGFLLKIGKPIGATFLVIAIIAVVLGVSRFLRTQALLKQGKYPATRFSVALLVFLILIISVITVVAIIYEDTR